MRTRTLVILAAAIICTFPVPATAQQPLTPAQAVDRIIAQEVNEMQLLRSYSPIVETYIQTLRPNKELGAVPDGDKYFLARADLARGLVLEPLVRKASLKHRLLGGFHDAFGAQIAPEGFLGAIYIDTNGFDRAHYNFQYSRREFLGEVRCLVFNVTPLPHSGKWRFSGRIWVEDQGYHIVRFNGVYGGSSPNNYGFNFDSWRVNAGRDEWLPAFIYTEEGDAHHGVANSPRYPPFKAQTRLWGYNLTAAVSEQELSKVLVESASPVKDGEASKDYSPLQAERVWDRQGEDNVLSKMQELGLLAPYGEIDKTLETVVNNVEVTNDLSIEPDVRCRILMTSTFESFAVGHTIVLSRGLIDVLPDEASLAALLSHELAHVLLGHRADSRYSFFNNMLFDERDVFHHFGFAHTPEEELAANQKGIALLKKSPYKDQLQTAQSFLRSLQQHSKEIPNLISPHLGDRVPADWIVATAQPAPVQTAGAQQATAAPQQNGGVSTQSAATMRALPLGARVKLQPWSDQLQMLKSEPVTAAAEYERAPFGITPFVLYLTREAIPAASSQSAETAQPAQPVERIFTPPRDVVPPAKPN